MIVPVVVTALGLVLVGTITQLFGYRLGGTIAIPVLAVYTLKNAFMLPVFFFSTILAYLGLSIVKQRTLIYGRDELLVAMGIGSGIPLLIFLTIGAVFPESLREVVFIGSILPGLAAFNYHQLKPQYRTDDLIATILLFSGLTTLGWFLVTPELAPVLGELTPPALYTSTSDVAVFKNAAVATELEPTILSRPSTILIFLIGLGISERVRARYGIRIGLISTALLAIYALASQWLIALYVIVLVTAFIFLQLVHQITLLYGRVLISITTAFALLSTVPLVMALPITRGLSAYFVGILAGINAYNWHTTPTSKRKLYVPLTLGTFTFLLLIVRATGQILPRGIPQQFGPVEILVGVAITVVCFLFVEYYTVDRPDHEEVFEASILSGSDER
ncbi:poly-gamma-glutamate biosynthesis protein PgsC/CapC [Haloarcula sp. S1AR25-5A]|uniref:Poly-gamma-glutamate biosynthesis protein PgsC/CapC n=1 Tax=Haloarcula terrestris TaxID=2950533 RepID=A0AAE4F0Y9_9EURY|nr:poly-gamma-glutamate biosynthesis protein PgsC/CapC [Haloarcula terrestris]MDS0222493.1 poly-gamma-glutamate biosynthesis protein PgsC/CapC [Haloarcula terrestris]